MKRKRNCVGERERPITVALAGNPNVGKSTLFNSLTGMRVHTGNWAGKTVGCESAMSRFGDRAVRFVDIPGTYSLAAHSEEERIARDYICFGKADVILVVCDAASLMQNLNLLLQITESGRKCVLAMNFIPEAKRLGVRVNIERLRELLGIPVVEVSADKKRDMLPLIREIYRTHDAPYIPGISASYGDEIERAVSLATERLMAIPPISSAVGRNKMLLRSIALGLMDSESLYGEELFPLLSVTKSDMAEIADAVERGKEFLFSCGIDTDEYRERVVSSLVLCAQRIAEEVTEVCESGRSITKSLDKILTGRVFAYPTMLLLLAAVFWITLSLANYPSELLSRMFEVCEGYLSSFFDYLGASEAMKGAFVSGLFRTLGRVVSVMLPPMVIFFPLFSILEDSGYLPRVAYNLDRPFAAAGACGKQALTMCMGFGCNAVGIVGCRIIDSERERRLAVITNSLVPCNGRLPMLITLISVFFIFLSGSYNTLSVTLFLVLFILMGIAATLLSTLVMSKTVFRGERSSFTIELPPYRRPKIFSAIYRALVDKCSSILFRAVIVSAPLGLFVWLLANIPVGEGGALRIISDFLDPFGRFFGMDGVIILSFIIGLPANEIVVPLMLMIYSSGGEILGEVGVLSIGECLRAAGWTPVTAITTAVFALFHFPCSTSLITVYKETHSKKYTLLAFLLPTLIGLTLCLCISFMSRLFS